MSAIPLDLKSRQYLIIGLVVVGVVFVVAIIPNIVSPRINEPQNPCMHLLRQIHGAKLQFVIEQGATNTTQITKEQILPYLKSWPECPAGGTYEIGKHGESPKCSYPAHYQYSIPQRH
jgi:hypothetical protein